MKVNYLIIGGGYFGCSIAYHLAKTGAPTLLVDSNEVISGASGANFGCVQVQDAIPGIAMDMTLEGFRLTEAARKELESDFEFRRTGSAVVAENEHQLELLEKRFENKRNAGLDVTWLTKEQLEAQEPNLAKDRTLAAIWYEQGILTPFVYLYAFLRKGKEYGLQVREHARVSSLLMSGKACTGARLESGEEIEADHVIISAGSGTRALCATAGLDVPVFTSKSESFVTESCRPFLRNTYFSAGFFAEAHDPQKAAASLCLAQTAHGNILAAETTKPNELFKPEHADLTSVEHCSRISKLALTYFPALKDIPVLRSWVTQSPYTPTMQPVFGPSEVPGLFVAAGFKSAAVMSKLVGEMVAEYFTDGIIRHDWSGFIGQSSLL